MADDPKTTIDDLVKELSKSPSQSPSPSAMANQGPPPNLPGVKIGASPIDPLKSGGSTPGISGSNLSKSAPSLAPLNVMPLSRPSVPLPSAMRPTQTPQINQTKPQMPVPAPSAPVQSLPKPFSPAPAQEYKTSIRTMGEDIASIKSGQKLRGVDIPRKVTQEIPKPMPGIAKPVTPEIPTGPRPSIELGRSEMSAPLPKTPEQKPSEIYKPPVAKMPAAQTQITSPISVPVKSRRFGGNMLYLLIGGLVIMGGFLYWYLGMRTTEPEIVISPTPTATVSTSPEPRKLSEIFMSAAENFQINPTETGSEDFRVFADSLATTAGEFVRINLVEEIDGTVININHYDLFDEALTAYPREIRSNILDSVVLVYGQKETFNIDSSANLTGLGLNKALFVSRIRSVDEVKIIMSDWEVTIANDLADYLPIADTPKEESAVFMNNTYRNVSIRYKNFPYPDISIDYAIVEMNGLSYLVISGSRESIYAAIDALLNQ